MGKSARVLGWEFGKTAQQMNETLHELGYLDGKPGAWRLTEKGASYAEEHSHSNGHGGWAARSWETRTWDDEIVEALRKDMAEGTEPLEDTADYSVEDSSSMDFEEDTSSQQEKDGWTFEAIVGVGFLAWAVASQLKPHVKPIYENKIKPVARQMRSKFKKDAE